MIITNAKGSQVAVDYLLVDAEVIALMDAGIKPIDLSDAIYYATDMAAAAGIDLELSDLDIDEALAAAYPAADAIAVRINEGGLYSQVAFLIAEFGIEDVRDQLSDFKRPTRAAS